jgi:hypothetical protein
MNNIPDLIEGLIEFNMLHEDSSIVENLQTALELIECKGLRNKDADCSCTIDDPIPCGRPSLNCVAEKDDDVTGNGMYCGRKIVTTEEDE